MNQKLQIIGLGRCVVGHLAKHLNTYESDKVFFQNYYLLNYTTCLKSSYSKEDISYLNNVVCMPTIYDQVGCLDEISKYNVCVLELFPPSRLYKHKSKDLFVCFESFTDELASAGFEEYNADKYEFATHSKEYVQSIERLILKIRSANKNIKIILVNGELIRGKDRPDVGSPLMYHIIKDVKKIHLLDDNSVKLVDINDLIDVLEAKKETVFEMAFPHIFVAYCHEKIQSAGFHRDCKHATSNIRTNLLKYFCETIEEFGFDAPCIEVENTKVPIAGNTFTERAKAYLEDKNKIKDIAVLLDSSYKFALFVSYAIEMRDPRCYDVIKEVANNLSSIYPSCGEDLKDYFYHIRALTAFVHETKTQMLKELCQINLRILDMPNNDMSAYTNFALLWITNIYLACCAILPEVKDAEELDWFEIFLEKLSQHSYLNNYQEVKKIVFYGRQNLEVIYEKI